MKCLVAVFLSVLATAIAAPQISNELTSPEVIFFDNFLDNKEFGPVLDEFLEEVAQVCKENNTDLKISLREAIRRAIDLDKKDLESMTVCTLLKTKLIYVTEPMVTAIDGCVWDDFAGIADFIVNVVVSVFDTICDYSVEEYLEIWNPCTLNTDYFNCMDGVEHRWGEITKENSKKTLQFCSAYREFKPCVEEANNKNCKLEITRKALSGIMDSILEKPCAI